MAMKSRGTSKRALLWIFPFLITCTYWIIFYFDTEFYYRWLVLSLWGISVVFFLYSASIMKISALSIRKLSPELLLVIAISIAISFFQLKNIPFVTIGDMLRDGGLDSLKILNGDTKNIFAYGRYESHGLIIPTFSALFKLIFGNTPMMFKAASAIVAVADLIFLYEFTKKYINPRSALISSLILLLTPLHLYYGRTEIVVIFSSLFTTFLLFALLRYVNNKTLSNLVIVSIIIGLSLNFHASVKTVSYLTLLILTLVVIYQSISTKHILPILGKGMLILVFIMIGFGPRLRYSPPSVLFHTQALNIGQEEAEKDNNKISDIYAEFSETYPKSLMVYFYEHTTSHFSDFAPIQPFSFCLFFLAGIIFLMKGLDSKSIITIYAMVIPFTNSALTDAVNGDHRLAPLLPISAIIIGYGTYMFTKMFRVGKLDAYFISLTVYGLVLLNLALNFYHFFYVIDVGAPAHNSRPEEEYLLTYANQVVKDNVTSKNVCLHLSSEVYSVLDLMHFKETFPFHNPDKNISLIKEEKLIDKTVYITRNCSDNLDEVTFKDYIYCEEFKRYLCPEKSGSLIIKLQDSI